MVRALWALVVTGVLVGLLVAWFAGWRLNVVASASMAPTVPQDALGLIVPVAAGQVETGDVVSFRHPADREQLVLHRVVEVIERPEGRFFRTQGDANGAPDPLAVPEDDLAGRLRGHVPHLGAVAAALRPPLGLALLAGLPLLVGLAGALRDRRARRAARGAAGDARP